MPHLLLALILGALAALSFIAHASNATVPGTTAVSAIGTTVYCYGEIKKVDAGQGKVTLKHGPIENLGMPAMTMVYRVTDPAKLANLKAGDMVKFKADRLDGLFVLTALERR
ncbi:copper-binding protein [Piscinibacter terrae]|uniref:Copper-binding protein n=1 Tax=Piscinibacter terrae TaxID=2496871 RepID=A0A3N7HMD6_9BURK|nr:copper-binding protein [Albitalea terrae]RQP21791.1 hypothetical protein DZC73_25440 [Albitalea terrae]